MKPVSGNSFAVTLGDRKMLRCSFGIRLVVPRVPLQIPLCSYGCMGFGAMPSAFVCEVKGPGFVPRPGIFTRSKPRQVQTAIGKTLTCHCLSIEYLVTNLMLVFFVNKLCLKKHMRKTFEFKFLIRAWCANGSS